MYTPTNSQKSCSSRVGSLRQMLQQFDHKINQISELKALITQRMISQEVEQSAKKSIIASDKQKQLSIYTQFRIFSAYFKNDVSTTMQKFLSNYHNKNMESVISIINAYQNQIKKYKNYYQAQIWDLRQQIKRQYKVIAMMKQQVEDLMVLMRYKQNEGQNHQPCQQWPQDINNNTDQQGNYQKGTKNNMRLSGLANRQFNGVLQIIQEQTERTLQSSQRSQGTAKQQQSQSRNFIKIQQKSEDEYQNIQKDMNQQKSQQKQYNLSQNNQNQYQNKQKKQQYNEDITPPQQDKVTATKDKLQLSSFYYIQRQTQRQPALYPTPIKKDSPYTRQPNYEEQRSFQSKNNRNEVKDDNINRGDKMYTAPADNRKADHLQSIFFLDDQSDDYYSKTSKIKNKEKTNNFDARYSQYSFSEEQNSLQDQSRNGRRRNQDTLYRNNSSIIGAQLYQEFRQEKALKDSLDFCNSIESSSIKSRQQKKHKSQSISHQKKTSQTMRHLTQQETNQYIYKTFNKVVPINDIQASASMPVPLTHSPLQQINSNMGYQREKKQQHNEQKPKTKQFLEQFRKTFNKCLKSMQVSKKNSGKIANNVSASSKNGRQAQGNNLITGVMTFGKGYPASNSMKQLQLKDKQNRQKQRQKQAEQYNHHSKHQSMKAVDHMLRELENNSKFIIGNKKLELKYEGEKKNGIRSGNGILYYSNGLCYQGEFRDGVRCGYGILKFNHIEIYNGDWVNDQIQGEGKIRNCAIINKRKTIYSSQSLLGKWISYSGQFKSSKFQGSGTLYLQGGQKFVGTFVNGYACGQGSIYKKNGEVQYGLWKNNILINTNKQKDKLC